MPNCANGAEQIPFAISADLSPELKAKLAEEGLFDAMAGVASHVDGALEEASVRLGDVARVALESAERRAYYRSNGEPAMGIGIVKTSTANSLQVARDVRAAARQIAAGACFVNTIVRSDVRLPFGGTKASGFGRELAEHGIHEFMNIKTVYVD